jgi:hypothetical protein
VEPQLFFTVPVLSFEKLWFRFQLLKSCGSSSGSYFWKVTVPVPVPAPYLDHKKQIFQKKCWKNFAFLLSKLFYKVKVYKFQQINCKMWMRKMLTEGNKIHNFISSSGSDFWTRYGSGSGSTGQKVTIPKTVPVPQCCQQGDDGGFVAVYAGGDGLVTAVATYQRDPVGAHYANLVHTGQKLRTSTAQQYFKIVLQQKSKAGNRRFF